MDKLLTVAIPTYNNVRQLLDCLKSFSASVEYPYQLIVVNNGDEVDTDGVRFEDVVRRASGIKKEDLTILQAPTNYGWSRAVNWAYKEADHTPFFAMANDDLMFLPYSRGNVRQMCSYFQYPEVGAVGPSSNFVMGSQNIWNHDLPLAYETTLLIGFFMIVRSKAFGEVGGLDEGLPGGDDLDFSILLRKHNWKLIVDRSCYVHHIGCQTGVRTHEGYWNSTQMVEETNNALIRKHGLRPWYDCIQSRVMTFTKMTQHEDVEGDVIRTSLHGLEYGLDIGCGGNKTIPSSVGVDLTPSGDQGKAGGTRFQVSEADVVADALDLKTFESESQDYIVARHLIEHIVDTQAALREWKRLLKPGGKLLLACPNERRCRSILLDWTHVHAFTPESLSDQVALAGLKINKVTDIKPGISFVLEAERE